MSTGDDVRAAVSARRDLGPEYEDAVVESFIDKMSAEIDRRVDERVARLPSAKQVARQSSRSDGMRLALAIVSLVMGTAATIVLLALDASTGGLIWIWGGLAMVNWAFASGMGERKS
ncbi:hypothetical protein ACIBKY_17050 [Nonomuraea sp. NPDC050394]|uniref:hypothetical protein n=1 Tax=Nonomuraea sp. NPDC050394 TaxID=3364363 RepID=UPI003789FF3D